MIFAQMPLIQFITGQASFRKDYKRLFKDQVTVSAYSSLRDGLRNAAKTSVDILVMDLEFIPQASGTQTQPDLIWFQKLAEYKNLTAGELGIIFLVRNSEKSLSRLRAILHKLDSETIDSFIFDENAPNQGFILEDLHIKIMKVFRILQMRRSIILLESENNTWLQSSPEITISHQESNRSPYSFLSGLSEKAIRLRKQLQLAAHSEEPVILFSDGLSEATEVADYLHSNSSRKQKHFYTLDFARIPRHLHGARLFGYRRPDNVAQNGAFELAGRGTLHLAGVENLSWDLQGELLRILQENEFQRQIDSSIQKLRCRIIISAPFDLIYKVENGTFRQDLYYKIQVFPVRIPTLAERKEDIPAIIDDYALWYTQKTNKPLEVTSQLKKLIMRKQWKGGVPELYEALYQILQMRELRENPGDLKNTLPVPEDLDTSFIRERNQGIPDPLFNDQGIYSPMTLVDLEKEHIQRVIKSNQGNMSESARVLGISRKTLYDKVRKYAIKNPDTKKHNAAS